MDKLSSESWIAFMSNKVKAGGGINLAQGIPGFDPPDDLLKALQSLSLKAVHQYPPGNGHSQLVDQICRRYSGSHHLSPDEVLVVQGATEGISLVYTYLVHKYGNNWSSLAFDPVYESYNELPKIFGNNVFKMPFEEGGVINKSMVEKYVSEKDIKLIFINSPGNPFGKIWTKEEYNWLFSLAETHDFFILLDAVYRDLYFSDQVPYFPEPGEVRRLFYVNSFSKMLSITGWRVGYLITARNMMKDIRSIHDYTGLCAPSILQYSISEYLSDSFYGKIYLREIRQKLAENYHFMEEELSRLGFKVALAEGGYFIWCSLSEEMGNGIDYAIQLYDSQKVGVVPGIHFSEAGDQWIRINIARAKEELEEALRRIKVFQIQKNADIQR